MLPRRSLLGGLAVGALAPAAHAQSAPTPGDYLRVLGLRNHVPALGAVVLRNGAVSDVMATGCDAATLFQAASISKVVAGLVLLRLHEKGDIDLDRPVNEGLRGWTLAGDGADRVTPRLLLCHRGGTTVGGFPGYAPGAPLPDLQQILEGRPPANSPPVTVAWPPGSAFHYSGGGTMVLQRLAVDVTGEPFERLAHDLVLRPAGMARSGFFQPLPDGERNVAAAHDAEGRPLPGRGRVYPELAAAGLWSTPGDLARLALAIAGSWTGTGTGTGTGTATVDLLRRSTAEALATRVGDGPTGLGVFVTPRGSRPPWIYHYGINAGFHSVLLFLADASFGVAIMANGDGGKSVIPEFLVPLLAAAGLEPFEPEP